MQAHPDRGGSTAEMMRINAAVDAAIALLEDADGRRVAARGSANTDSVARRRRRYGSPLQVDQSTFVIEALPALAYEALLLAFVGLGDASVQDPPYLLAGDLGDPIRCWCQLDLVPEAGASTVSMAIAPLPGSPVIKLEAVRDALVAELNALDWEELTR